jgi:hypothetical protein
MVVLTILSVNQLGEKVRGFNFPKLNLKSATYKRYSKTIRIWR